MKKILQIIAAFFISATVVNSAAKAQVERPLALGLRLTPDGAGVTAKYFLSNNISIEGQYNSTDSRRTARSMEGVGLIEYNFHLSPSWNLFAGGGGYYGSMDVRRFEVVGTYPQQVYGINGIVGLEYTLPCAPVAFSLDYKPAINLSAGSAYQAHQVGFSIKYYFCRGFKCPKKVSTIIGQYHEIIDALDYNEKKDDTYF